MLNMKLEVSIYVSSPWCLGGPTLPGKGYSQQAACPAPAPPRHPKPGGFTLFCKKDTDSFHFPYDELFSFFRKKRNNKPSDPNGGTPFPGGSVWEERGAPEPDRKVRSPPSEPRENKRVEFLIRSRNGTVSPKLSVTEHCRAQLTL